MLFASEDRKADDMKTPVLMLLLLGALLVACFESTALADQPAPPVPDFTIDAQELRAKLAAPGADALKICLFAHGRISMVQSNYVTWENGKELAPLLLKEWGHYKTACPPAADRESDAEPFIRQLYNIQIAHQRDDAHQTWLAEKPARDAASAAETERLTAAMIEENNRIRAQEAAEEGKAAAEEKKAAKSRRAKPVSAQRYTTYQTLMCNDGSESPSCSCGGSHRGCCSHHGGVDGCRSVKVPVRESAGIAQHTAFD